MKNQTNFKLILPKTILDYAVLLNFIAFFAIRNIPIFFWAAQVLFAFLTLLSLKGKKVNLAYFIYSLIFMFWIIMTFFWSESLNYALKFLRESSQILLICSCLSFYCNSFERLNKCICYVVISLCVCLAYLIIKTPIYEWINIYNYNESITTSLGRLGYTIGLHPNQMGSICTMGCLLSFFLLKNNKKTRWLIMFILFLILLFFTKSRGSILCTACAIILYWLFESRKEKKVILKFALILILAAVGYWAIFNITPLYNLVGFRFEGIRGIFDSSYKVDGSTNGREMLIKAGIQMIKDHPLIGVGAGNYAYVAYSKYDIWKEVYSHSNYIEIWSSLGLIGTLIYYIPRLWCIKKLFMSLNFFDKQIKSLFALLFSFSVSIVVFDYIKISYSNEPVQLMYSLCFCAAILFCKEKRKKDENKNLKGGLQNESNA